MQKLITYILFILLAGFFSCVNPPDYSNVPEIEFVSLSKPQLIQGNAFQDTLVIIVSFTDGDGDIGSDEGVINMTLTDSRTGLESQSFKLPTIPNANEKYGVSGEIELTVYTVCCRHPTLNQICQVWDDFPTDEFFYEIKLTDRAGNESNIIQTDPIELLCN